MDVTHKGHRDRVRQRFLTEGLAHFDDVTMLELLLFYAIPRKDTNPIAHKLLDTFGSLPAILQARPQDLQAVEGMTKNAAILIAMLPQLLRRYWKDSSKQGDILTTTAQCGQYLTPLFLLERDELVYLLCLDAKCKVLECTLINRGSVNNANVSVRKIVENALRCNATSVVLAHNHTSGIALPSPEDLATTENLAQALKVVGIQLADHIIVADNDFVSLKDSGYLK